MLLSPILSGDDDDDDVPVEPGHLLVGVDTCGSKEAIPADIVVLSIPCTTCTMHAMMYTVQANNHDKCYRSRVRNGPA